MPSKQICVKAFDGANHLLMEQYYSLSEWYGDLHPLLDDEDIVRAKYRVRSIVIERTEETVISKWRNLYSEVGVLIASYVWKNDEWFADELFVVDTDTQKMKQ